MAASYSLYQAAWAILLVAVPVFVTRQLASNGAAEFAASLLWAV
jgi:hypothetical protein